MQKPNEIISVFPAFGYKKYLYVQSMVDKRFNSFLPCTNFVKMQGNVNVYNQPNIDLCSSCPKSFGSCQKSKQRQRIYKIEQSTTIFGLKYLLGMQFFTTQSLNVLPQDTLLHFPYNTFSNVLIVETLIFLAHHFRILVQIRLMPFQIVQTYIFQTKRII